LARLWNAFRFLFGGRRAVFHSITACRSTHPDDFKADMVALFKLLSEGAIYDVSAGLCVALRLEQIGVNLCHSRD